MIQVILDNPTAVFAPGATLVGAVRWSEIEGSSLEIRLIWYTRGKGDRDFSLIGFKKYSDIAESGSEQFEFCLPSRPLSFSGKLIALQWAIEAISFPDHVAERATFTLSKSKREIVLEPVKVEFDR